MTVSCESSLRNVELSQIVNLALAAPITAAVPQSSAANTSVIKPNINPETCSTAPTRSATAPMFAPRAASAPSIAAHATIAPIAAALPAARARRPSIPERNPTNGRLIQPNQ